MTWMVRVDVALSELLDSAESTDWNARVDAAERLSGFLSDDRARRALLRLLNDPTNSAPAVAAARSLLQEGSDHALRLFAVGWERAGDESGDDIASELLVAHESGARSVARWRELIREDDDEVTRRGIESIIDWLGE